MTLGTRFRARPPSIAFAAAIALTGCLGAVNGPADAVSPPTSTARASALATSWACLVPVFVDDLNTTSEDARRCETVPATDGATLVVRTTGIPNHDFHSGPGCCARERSYAWRIPLDAVNATGTLTSAPTRGPIAVAVDGVPLYGPEDGPGGDAVALSRGYYTEARQRIWLGLCDGHSAGANYHYHADANCVHWHPDAASGQAWTDYSFDVLDPTTHSKIIGWAFDGYPVYGSFGYGEDGKVRELRSSYRLMAGRTGSGGIADYEYVDGLGDLDRCNGRWTVTPEFPVGTYAYASTLRNGEGRLGFPYFLMCYRGVPDAANFQAGG